MVLLESHGQVEHILEERRMKIEKHENENFPIFLQNMQHAKFDHKNTDPF